ncbi:hypothetical protein GCM10009767_11000 [Kocuria aegyptia]|uniref:Resolvase/invertase-type recombinase catalytic domain-containing protein n=1 Tax=Kocuria aegyptia TaxID=330943 RepID=A0ABN2KFL7_9MICC
MRASQSMQNMLAFSEQLRSRGLRLRVLDLGVVDVGTHTSMGSMVFTVKAALAQMELEIKRERVTDSVAKRRAAGKDLGGRRPTFTDSQIRAAVRLIDAGGGHPGRPRPRDVPGDPVPADPGAAAAENLRPSRPGADDADIAPSLPRPFRPLLTPGQSPLLGRS